MSLKYKVLAAHRIPFPVQDTMELPVEDLHAAVRAMHTQRRFRELLIVLDTCESESMFGVEGQPLGVPGVGFLGSSALHENSYAHGSDSEVGGTWCQCSCVHAP